MSVLCVAGEPSGDLILARLRAHLPGATWGLYGDEVSKLSASGTTEAITRLPRIAKTFSELLTRAKRTPPRAAVLVDYTEANAWLGKRLRRLGIPVVWIVAPQVWAWRPGRVHSLASAMDRLGTLFPFETAAFTAVGVDAHWIGHPAVEVSPPHVEVKCGVALLPGSRPGEVRRLLPVLLNTSCDGPRTVLAAAGLDGPTRTWLDHEASRSRCDVLTVPPGGLIPALAPFARAIVAAGTATLECALAGVPQVVFGKVSPVTAWLLRRWLITPFVSLPNVLLGRNALPELLQDDATPLRIARALASLGDQSTLRAELLPLLTPDTHTTFGARAASLVQPFLNAS